MVPHTKYATNVFPMKIVCQDLATLIQEQGKSFQGHANARRAFQDRCVMNLNAGKLLYKIGTHSNIISYVSSIFELYSYNYFCRDSMNHDIIRCGDHGKCKEKVTL